MSLNYYIFTLMLLMLSLSLDAQIVFSKKKHDFGEISTDSQRWIDIQVENKGEKEVKIIKVTNPDNMFEFKFSSMDILPNSSNDIRIQFNPLEKGKQKIDLIFYFDREIFDFTISANVLKLSKNYTACPDFANPSSDVKTFETTFRVFNKATKKPISNASIKLSSKLSPLELSTKKNGTVTEVVPLSYYTMYIEAKGYVEADSSGYINSRNHDFTFYLTPIEEHDEEITEVIKEIIQDEEEVVVAIESENKDESEEVVEIVEDDSEEFSRRDYAPNNIVFLMDVSTSMKKENRLEMLKESLKSLTDMMRSDDIISLITYASTTDILLEGQSMADKEMIKEIISNIDGKGTTAGGKGIKKAFALAAKHKIEGGNNHVYIATDGAFNKNDDQLIKTIARQSKKGFQLSVLSLNSSEFAKTKMIELTEAGQGDFVNIEEMGNISLTLRSMIKKQSKIDR